jgi:hypothetical protein
MRRIISDSTNIVKLAVLIVHACSRIKECYKFTKSVMHAYIFDSETRINIGKAAKIEHH